MLRNNTEYFLLEMHFHAPSEHTFDGKNFPVEFHFIHKDNDENILAIGVMGIAGNTNNEAWEPFVAAATQDGSVSENIELSALLPQSTEHYAYEGSLTTPPCSEGVEWIVLTTPVELSAEQIATLTAAYSNNSRPLQLRNGRPITKTSP
jgi:carbonic anhydrase